MTSALNAVKTTFSKVPEKASELYNSATATGSKVAGRYNVSIKSLDPYHNFCEKSLWNKLSTGVISAVSVGSIGLLFTKKWKDRYLSDRRILGVLVAIGLYCAGFGIYHLGKVALSKIQAFRERRTEKKITKELESLLSSNTEKTPDEAIEAIENYYNDKLKGHKIIVCARCDENGENQVITLSRSGKEAFFSQALTKEVWDLQKAKELQQEREEAIVLFKTKVAISSEEISKEQIQKEIMDFYVNEMHSKGFAFPSPNVKDSKPVIEFKIENGKVFDTVEISQNVLDHIAEKRESNWFPIITGYAPKPTGNLHASMMGGFTDLMATGS